MAIHSRNAAVGALAFLAFLGLADGPASAQDIGSPSGAVLRIGPSVVTSAAHAFRALPPPWVDSRAVRLPRYPFMADPRRWPRLFANTTLCTLSLNPITHRHWWQG